jgi:hypothetical protein
MREPDQIDMMSDYEVRSELRDVVTQNVELQHSLSTAEREIAELRREKQAFADEVIALITTEQEAMRRLYSKHTYGINKVCNRLKLFVGDLARKPTAYELAPSLTGEDWQKAQALGVIVANKKATAQFINRLIGVQEYDILTAAARALLSQEPKCKS